MIDVSKINFKKFNGLVPTIIVDNDSEKVLMLGFMNDESLSKTIETGKTTFYSRSRKSLWTKGETSGNYLFVKKILTDCDNDSLLIYADPSGPTCHTGNYSCFSLEKSGINFLEKLNDLVKQRKVELPKNSYTTKLFKEGSDRIIQKVGEESVEVVIAAKNKSRKEIVYESADLLFHLLVMLTDNNIELKDVVSELESRHKPKQ
jgi:phosphoribosyl-ATP pyrophosphohydrolase/phosphoribosyl-AMP cyclohydrolase